MKLHDIVLDGFNRSILNNVKSKIKARVRVFLCDRYSASEKDEIAFCELTEKGGFIKTVNDNHILVCITKCYLNNSPIQDENKYFSSINSKIGSLGVVLFEAVNPSEGMIITGPNETYIEKSMSALGQGILSNLCLVEKTIGKTINDKLSHVYEYLPFANCRNCVCMFVNIKDFVNVHSNSTEADMFYNLQNFSEILKSIANSHYGIVNCIFGGSALILFNTLIYEEIKIACRRAICAALQIRKEIKSVFHVDTYVGIGSNAGETFFFDFGNPYNYTCFGKIVSNTKKIENVSGKRVGYGGGRTVATDSEYIMLSERFYSELDEDLKNYFRDLDVPQVLYDYNEKLYGIPNEYNENLYGIPNETGMKTCNNSRLCLNCPKLRTRTEKQAILVYTAQNELRHT